MAVKKGLGKGLEALFLNAGDDSGLSPVNGVVDIDINKIEPNGGQPRQNFDAEKLNELAESIKTYGIIQPIIVNKEDGYYTIITGERRWRAARAAGLAAVPAIVREYTDIEAYETALIENIQRADLNPVEEALCYKKLIDEYSMTQDQLAQKIGKNRSHISNSLRLLNFDDEIKDMIISGGLSMGHAKALLPVGDETELKKFARKIAGEELNVRDTEKMVANYLYNIKYGDKTDKSDAAGEIKNPAIKTIENELREALGTKVVIKDWGRKGRIEIDYGSYEELDGLYMLLKNN